MTEPTTAAGRELWEHFAPAPLPEAQELHRRSAQGRRDKLVVGIAAIEAQARADALREAAERVRALPQTAMNYWPDDSIYRAAVLAILGEKP